MKGDRTASKERKGKRQKRKKEKKGRFVKCEVYLALDKSFSFK
jgi:hypothetical protein